ncbi:hypothetical protein Bbelb_098170 [Branchiostoma belcheri]|nr:hypothetical protein Bbelb_098170 [Branchiostoma belcheri]
MRLPGVLLRDDCVCKMSESVIGVIFSHSRLFSPPANLKIGPCGQKRSGNVAVGLCRATPPSPSPRQNHGEAGSAVRALFHRGRVMLACRQGGPPQGHVRGLAAGQQDGGEGGRRAGLSDPIPARASPRHRQRL